ncbi:hypothetical protein GCM10023331_21630 [Algivirga pacifica]|uniref:Uncharacterized protein n=1 Tax=Algivirga pacifica TaxID=1162670 RepID=A0ABP9D9J3_9BACT
MIFFYILKGLVLLIQVHITLVIAWLILSFIIKYNFNLSVLTREDGKYSKSKDVSIIIDNNNDNLRLIKYLKLFRVIVVILSYSSRFFWLGLSLLILSGITFNLILY